MTILSLLLSDVTSSRKTVATHGGLLSYNEYTHGVPFWVIRVTKV